MNTKDKLQTSNVDAFKSSQQSTQSIKIGLIICGFALLAWVFYIGLVIGKNLIKKSTNTAFSALSQNQISNTQSQEQPSSQQPATNDIYQKIRIYPSLNRNFSFYIYPTKNDTECLYGIIDMQGYDYDIIKAFGTDKIKCSEEMGHVSSSFAGWADGNKFLFEEQKGNIKIVSVGKSEAETYAYDASKYFFVGADRTLKHWLFGKNQGNNVSYVILDRNKNVVLDNIDFESNNRGVLYDEINNGFLFINRTFTENTVSITFDFLSLNNLKLRNILTTEPVMAPAGRGCVLEYLISQPGEIVLTQGCLTVNDKYLDSDKNIRIKL